MHIQIPKSDEPPPLLSIEAANMSTPNEINC